VENQVVPVNERKDQVLILAKLLREVIIITQMKSSAHGTYMIIVPMSSVIDPTLERWKRTFTKEKSAKALDLSIWSSFQESTGLIPLSTTKSLKPGEYIDPVG